LQNFKSLNPVSRRVQSLLTAMCFGWVSLCLAAPVNAAKTDVLGPRVLHEVVSKGTLGSTVDVTAKMEDESGIFEPKVYFRRIGESEFNAIDMLSKPNGIWVASIPATLVTRDIEYFVEAFDTMGNGPTRHGTPDRPHFIKVSTKNDVPQGSGARDLTADTAGLRQPGAPINGTSTPVEPVSSGDSVVTKWWFWTIIVAVAAGATIGALCLTKTGICKDGGSQTFDPVTVRVSGGDLRDGL
jgi:hypothetical protein